MGFQWKKKTTHGADRMHLSKLWPNELDNFDTPDVVDGSTDPVDSDDDLDEEDDWLDKEGGLDDTLTHFLSSQVEEDEVEQLLLGNLRLS